MMGYYMLVEDENGPYWKEDKSYRLLTASGFDLNNSIRSLSAGTSGKISFVADWHYFDNEDCMMAAFGIKRDFNR